MALSNQQLKSSKKHSWARDFRWPLWFWEIKYSTLKEVSSLRILKFINYSFGFNDLYV